ncbi:FCD domain-containing protein [Microbacterium ulmi]|uniref:GntR family transcriptional regulator n=1 Tax=Microbacterium ulmi TaxID=179095 RepID=A0A7Y2PZT9_9MICO|nr:DNA-binding GntR family transcriptional regulator [Microbacterium ulmi]NNH03653.1 GntR family transcriptional regulator [Microbacterium ulmi]
MSRVVDGSSHPSSGDIAVRRRTAITPVSTVSALAAELRLSILGGEFRAGDQLREIQLAERYRVARHSVRAALHLLSQQGLLTHRPNRGVFVPEMTQDEIADIFRLRSAIEVEAITQLASEGVVAPDVESAFSRLAEAPSTEWGVVIGLDLDFHRSLVQATGSRRLSDAFSDLLGELQLCLVDLERAQLPSQWLTESHALILDSVRAADPTLAAATVRSHLVSSRRQLEEIHGWHS